VTDTAPAAIDPRVPVLLNTVHAVFGHFSTLASRVAGRLPEAEREQLVELVAQAGDELKALYAELGAADTPEHAARLIAAAFNAAAEYRPWIDDVDGTIRFASGNGDTAVRQGRDGAWQVAE
jgi:hypothetical protein